MSANLARKFIDLVHQASGEWTNWDPPKPVQLGDFGTLNETGQFIVDGNIYSDEFRRYLKGIKSAVDLNAYPARFTEFDPKNIMVSSGVERKELDADKIVDMPGISSASLKNAWKFEDGKRGALLILVSPYTVSIPETILANIPEVERLVGKHLVTRVRICPAYLMLLSNKSGQTVSVAFSPTALGANVANNEGAGWWTNGQSALLRRKTHRLGKPIFTPLFTLKQRERSGWKDVHPTWGTLGEDGEMETRARDKPSAPLFSSGRRGWSGEPTDVLFVGQTGVGKSTLINMVRHDDTTAERAMVSNDANACTMHTTHYPMQLEAGLSCRLWDTRGLGETVDNRDRFMAKIVSRIRQLAAQQERELKETLRNRTRLAKLILVWCIDAAKIDVAIHWQEFRKVYVEYCEGNAIPVVVITRMSPRMDGWEQRCRDQLRSLGLGDAEVQLLRVRKHRSTSSPEYAEDGDALRGLITQITASL